jgi:hypothetical protein
MFLIPDFTLSSAFVPYLFKACILSVTDQTPSITPVGKVCSHTTAVFGILYQM